MSTVILAIVRFHAFHKTKSLLSFAREISFLREQCYVIGVCYSWLARADALSEPMDREKKESTERVKSECTPYESEVCEILVLSLHFPVILMYKITDTAAVNEISKA